MATEKCQNILMATEELRELNEMSLVDCNKYMLENQINSDVTFLVGETPKQIKAHKYVLGSRNTVFDAMLHGPLAEKGKITIPDIEPSIFNSLLTFFYADDMEVTANNVYALMYACNKYTAKGAMQKCTHFLNKFMNPENVCEVLESALLYNEADLTAECLALIFKRPKDILKSESFTELSPDSLKIIIESDRLAIEECLIYESIIAWADHECRRQRLAVTDENIKTVLGDLIYLVRFPLMSAQYFADNVAPRRILSEEIKLDIFMYKNRSKKIISNEKIITESRDSVLKYVHRFSSSQSLSPWFVSSPDAIDFSVSEDIFLHGVVMYGCDSRNSDYNISCRLINGATVLSACKQKLKYTGDCETFDVFLPSPVKLVAKTTYTFEIAMEGMLTRKGLDGYAVVTKHDVEFRFQNSFKAAFYRSTVIYGQIPGLIFSFETLHT